MDKIEKFEDVKQIPLRMLKKVELLNSIDDSVEEDYKGSSKFSYK